MSRARQTAPAPDWKGLEKNIGYTFHDIGLLKNALTHSSYANESKKSSGSNERLEFLGDSVLGYVVADYLFRNCPHLPEGDLTKTRAALVCEKACCGFSRQLEVGKYLLLSHGELEIVEKSNLDSREFKEKIIAALKEEEHV